jgi:hypothetical protein
MKKILLLIAFAILWASSVSADNTSLDKFSFSETEYNKIIKEKILTKVKLEKTFPKYKWATEKLDKKILNKLWTLGMQARRDYLKKNYASLYQRYENINESRASVSKKNLAKLVFKYIMLESYVMYYRNK